MIRIHFPDHRAQLLCEKEASPPLRVPRAVTWLTVHRAPDMVLRNGSLVCKVCGRGAESAGKMARGAPKGLEETERRSIQRRAESAQMASNIWGFSAVRDPDHQPAWKKRRRS